MSRHYVLEVAGYYPDNVIDLRDADQVTPESVFGKERSHKGTLWRYLKPGGGSDVVVYYSGHGVPGLDKRSYLLPVDADPDNAEINGYPWRCCTRTCRSLRRPGRFGYCRFGYSWRRVSPATVTVAR